MNIKINQLFYYDVFNIYMFKLSNYNTFNLFILF